MLNCDLCKWGNGFSGNARVCGLALHGGEVVFIYDGLAEEECCPMHASEQASRVDRAIDGDFPNDDFCNDPKCKGECVDF